MTATTLLLLASLAQSPRQTPPIHPVPDTAAVHVLSIPADLDAKLPLLLIAGLGLLQLLVIAVPVWLLRNSVKRIEASSDAIQINTMTEVRAFLNVTIASWRHPGAWRDGEPPPTLQITNSGKTPAKDVRARFEYEPFETSTHVHGMAVDGPKARWGVLGSGGALDVPVFGAPVPEEKWPALEAGSGHTLFVYGEVWYSDVFGVERQTAFCRHINWRNGEMVSSIPDYGNDFT
jgi:hypothetical protein